MSLQASSLSFPMVIKFDARHDDPSVLEKRMNHDGEREGNNFDALSGQVFGCAIEVHRRIQF